MCSLVSIVCTHVYYTQRHEQTHTHTHTRTNKKTTTKAVYYDKTQHGIFGVIALCKLHNDTETRVKRWKMRCRTRALICFRLSYVAFLLLYLCVCVFSHRGLGSNVVAPKHRFCCCCWCCWCCCSALERTSRATHSGTAAQGPSAVPASTAGKCALSRITLAREQTCVYILTYTVTLPCGMYVCPFLNVAVLVASILLKKNKKLTLLFLLLRFCFFFFF